MNGTHCERPTVRPGDAVHYDAPDAFDRGESLFDDPGTAGFVGS